MPKSIVRKQTLKRSRKFLFIVYLGASVALFVILKLFTQSYLLKLISTDELLIQKNPNLPFLVAILGPKNLLEDLVNESEKGTKFDCHQQAHTLGRESYKIYGAVVFKDGSYACNSGFYHGAMEGFLHENGTENLGQKILKACGVFDKYFGLNNCFHGVGHGLMAYENYDLPQVINDCKELKSIYAVAPCYGGAFMENIMTGAGAGAFGYHKTNWLSKDPHFPCNYFQNDRDAQNICYQQQTSRMGQLYNYDTRMIIEKCLEAPTDMIGACFISLGRDIVTINLRDTDLILTKCKMVPSQYRKKCIEGSLAATLNFDTQADQALYLCKKTTEYKEFCYERLTTWFSQISDDSNQKKRVCESFEIKYQYLCKSS